MEKPGVSLGELSTLSTGFSTGITGKTPVIHGDNEGFHGNSPHFDRIVEKSILFT